MMIAGPRAENQMSRSSCPATTSQPALGPEGRSIDGFSLGERCHGFSSPVRYRKASLKPSAFELERKNRDAGVEKRPNRTVRDPVFAVGCTALEGDVQPTPLSFDGSDTGNALRLSYR